MSGIEGWMRGVERTLVEYDRRLRKPVMPVGTIVLWPSATPPFGWLLANGATFSSTTYPALATILGGTTLPNLAAVGSANYIIKT